MAAPYYQYGYVDPGRPRAEARECRLNEPILYTYMVPPPEQAVAQQPPQPPAPPAPPALPPVQPPAPPPPDQGAVTVTGPAAGQTAQGGIQIGMTQHIYSNVPIQGGQAIQTQYASPAPPRPVAGAYPGTVPWQGPTVAQVNARNAAIAQATGATRPQSMIPYKPAEGQQWWCRELDGAYTLRSTNDIMENLQPGMWHYSTTGYPYFVRHAVPGT